MMASCIKLLGMTTVKTEYVSSYWASWTEKKGDSKTYRDDSTESDLSPIGQRNDFGHA